MKKLAILFIHLLPILFFGQKIIIDENKDQFETKDLYVYECKESVYLFEEGLADIYFVDNDTLYIKNESNTGASGIYVSFKIDKEMNVHNPQYYTWDDVEDGSTTDFSIQDFTISLNKNPFKSGITNLKGIYNLKVKSEFDPGPMFLNRGVKPKTEIFTYKASFECKK